MRKDVANDDRVVYAKRFGYIDDDINCNVQPIGNRDHQPIQHCNVKHHLNGIVVVDDNAIFNCNVILNVLCLIIYDNHELNVLI